MPSAVTLDDYRTSKDASPKQSTAVYVDLNLWRMLMTPQTLMQVVDSWTRFLEIVYKEQEQDPFVWCCLVRASRPATRPSLCPLKIMLSSTLRTACPCVCRIPGRRFASHGAPQFNEPSGYLFGEKVRSDEIFCWKDQFEISRTSSLFRLGRNASRRIGRIYGTGECLGLWHLQLSYYIISPIQGTSDPRISSIQLC